MVQGRSMFHLKLKAFVLTDYSNLAYRILKVKILVIRLYVYFPFESPNFKLSFSVETVALTCQNLSSNSLIYVVFP